MPNFLPQYLIVFVSLLFINSANSQNLYGGIEIGSKGVKMTILNVKNAKKAQYHIVDFWTENTAIAKNIAIDGCLDHTDILKTVLVVNRNFEIMLRKHNVPNNKIFIVASSGVGLSTNVEELASLVKTTTGKELEVLSSKLESKLMYRGCIPPSAYMDAMLLDIGGGNTKGGYADVQNENLVFFPLNLDLGTITLTEQINKNITNLEIDNFLDESLKSQIKLSNDVKDMFAQRELSTSKKNIYMTGGAVWAFYTLYHQSSSNIFNLFTIGDVKEYGAKVKNNFESLKKLSKINPEALRVLQTYSQKHLISANTILVTLLENMGNVDNKKLYFAKNGQIAWLMTYVADSSKGVKVIY